MTEILQLGAITVALLAEVGYCVRQACVAGLSISVGPVVNISIGCKPKNDPIVNMETKK
jgi:hypothetical protein